MTINTTKATGNTVDFSTTPGVTGTGSYVMHTSPTLVTPTLGVASATSVNKVSITAPASSAALTIANGKTLTASNTLTFTGTDSTSFAFPSTSGTVATLAMGQTLTNKTINGASNTLTVRLANDVSGFLPIGNLISTASVPTAQFLRGDGTWSAPPGSTVGPSGDVTGATDTAVIQAILSAGSAAVLQPGQFYINAALTWPVNTPASLIGAGAGVTVINQVSTTANGITINNSSFTAEMGTIFGITIKAASSTGIGISLNKIGTSNPSYGGGFIIDGVFIHGFTTGLKVNDCWFSHFSNIYLTDQKTDGILIDGSTTGTGGHSFSGIELINPQAEFTASSSGTTLTVTAMASGSGTIRVGDSITYAGVNSAGGPPTVSALGSGTGGTGTYTLSASVTAGSQAMKARRNSSAIHVKSSGGNMWNNIGQEAATQGLLIDPTSTSVVAYQWFTNAVFDDNARDGVRVVPASTATVLGLFFNNCWTSYNHGTGVVMLGTVTTPINNVHFIGHNCHQNQYQGMYLAGYTHFVRIQDSNVSDNSSVINGGTTNTWPGIHVAGNTLHLQVTGNCLGNVTSTDQSYGLQLDTSGSNYIIVQGNDTFTSSTKSGGLGILDNSGAATKSITGNL